MIPSNGIFRSCTTIFAMKLLERYRKKNLKINPLDQWIWTPSACGVYNVKYAQKALNYDPPKPNNTRRSIDGRTL